MADLDDEKAPQHVQPDRPDRGDDPPPSADPNDTEPGSPQHETHTEYDDKG